MQFEIDDDEVIPHGLWTVLVKYRAGWRCEDCGADADGRSRSIHAHHVNADSEDNRLANGRSLCSRCHADTHNLIRALRPSGKRRGRPPADTVAQVEEIAQLLAVDPDMKAGEIAARVTGRRQDVLRLVRTLRELGVSAESLAARTN